MISIVAVVAEVIYCAELRIGPKILVLATDPVEGREVAGDIERKHIDVPVVEQPHSGRALIHQFGHPVLAELVLNSARPVHYVRHAHVWVEPGDLARAEIATDEGRAAVRSDIES